MKRLAALLAAFFALAWASWAQATDGVPVSIGDDGESAAVTSKTWSVTVDCPVGALLTVMAHIGAPNLTISVADNATGGSNTYTGETAVNTGSGGSTNRFFHTIVARDMAIGKNLIFTWGGVSTTTNSRMSALCTTGMGALDVAGTWSVVNAQTTSVSTGTLAVPNETVFSMNDEDTGNNAWTANSPFTQVHNQTFGGRTQTAYDVTAACTSVTSAPSIATSAQNIAVNVYSFQSTTPGSCGGGGGVTPRGTLLGVYP